MGQDLDRTSDPDQQRGLRRLWLASVHAPGAGREYEEYEASGNGGQFVIVVPALEFVIAITAGNLGD